ncbi:MAG: type II 3-dehydroquinate dehydratase [Bacteroidota bacterium]|jgi:3-dehydroquinate dehydratase-2
MSKEKRIIIINGPNLNLLGQREPEIYGHTSFDDYFSNLIEEFPDVHLEYFQSSSESGLIDELHRVGFSYDGIIINAGAYAHTSIALADAIAAIDAPVIEVHISNVYRRETYRHHSWLTAKCKGLICGLGLHGYALAVSALTNAS